MSSPDCTVYLYLAISVSHKASMTCNVVNLQYNGMHREYLSDGM